jgi:DNA-binding MarR family transcriptional regulator
MQRLTLGSLLRQLIDLLDGDVEKVYIRDGLDHRPRFTPIIRALIDLGPSSIRVIALRVGVSHSAISQTLSQMKKRGLIRFRSGGDGRERIVSLTPKAEAMVPTLEEHWTVTNAAAKALDEELSTPLTKIVREAISALERRPFIERIDESIQQRRKKKR